MLLKLGVGFKIEILKQYSHTQYSQQCYHKFMLVDQHTSKSKCVKMFVFNHY